MFLNIHSYFSDPQETQRRSNIPVLSGTAYVGQLYDAKTDQLIPDHFLWKEDQMKIKEANVTNVFFETKIEESQLDRMNMIDIDASLKLSFMGGLIQVWRMHVIVSKYAFKLFHFIAFILYFQLRYQDQQIIYMMRSFQKIG